MKFVSCLVSVLAVSSVAFAQQPFPEPFLAPDPPQPAGPQGIIPQLKDTARYRGFDFSMPFTMGALYVGNAMEEYRETLHMEWAYNYHGPTQIMKAIDSTNWRIDTTPGANYRWEDRINAEHYANAMKAGVKLIYPLDSLGGAADATVAENYYGYQDQGAYNRLGEWTIDSMQALDYQDRVLAPIIEHHWPQMTWAGFFARDTAAGPIRMAGRPAGTTLAFLENGIAPYRLMNRLQDTNKVDLTLTFNAENVDSLLVNATDSLAFVKMYRRVQLGQRVAGAAAPCDCLIFDTAGVHVITKGKWYDTVDVLSSDPHAGSEKQPYRDVTFTFYAPDTSKVVPDSNLVVVVDTASYAVMHAGDTVRKYVPAAAKIDGGVEASDTIPGNPTFCAKLFQELKERRYISDSAVFRGPDSYSSVTFDVYSSRLVPVTFLRTRLGAHSFMMMRHGWMDSLIMRTIDSMHADDSSRKFIARIAVRNEPHLAFMPAFREVSSRIVRRLYQLNPADTRGIYMGAIGNMSAWRPATGDLDSTDYRMLHMLMNQDYAGINPIPVFYANPAQMRDSNGVWSKAVATYYAHRDTTVAGIGSVRQMIIYNTPANQRAYDTLGNLESNGLMSSIYELQRIARWKYARYNPAPLPVMKQVQVHGYLEPTPGYSGYTGRWYVAGPRTPEQITRDVWLNIAAGADGICYSDFEFDGFELGPSMLYGGEHEQEWDTVSPRHPTKNSKVDSARWMLPKMWLGFNSRFNAIRKVNEILHHAIIPVYQGLDRSPTWVFVERATDSIYSLMPMVSRVRTRLARRFAVGGEFVDSTALDPPDSTYVIASVFRPAGTPDDTSARYLVLVNKRVWPVDTTHYDSSVVQQFDTTHTSDSLGLGAASVRKPVVWLKNSLNLLADEFRVEQIGDSTWSRTVRVGDSLELDWLEPGWGAMYRITPIVNGVSDHGVAFNNAVRFENPTINRDTSAVGRSRVAVFERNGLVFLQLLDSVTGWQREVRISDRTASSADTSDVNPAIATVRDGGSCLVVWEKRVRSGASVISSIEARRLAGPSYDSVAVASSSRRQLASPAALADTSWVRAPAVVGLLGGYIAAWGSPSNGISVRAVRDTLLTATMVTSTVGTVKATSIRAYGTSNYPVSATAFFPTLAYVPNRSTVPDEGVQYQIAHMAWQQGTPNVNRAQFILHKPIGARFTAASNPMLYLTYPIEHVSEDLGGCGFFHPSIAADSMWVAVGFEQHTWGTRNVILRFRDTTWLGPGGRWSSTLYRWGGYETYINYGGRTIGIFPRWYEWPSVTEFPLIARAEVRNGTGRPQGALTWYQTNYPTGRGRQFIYRYGWDSLRTLPHGQYPTMALVSRRTDTPFVRTGVLYRGDTTTQFLATFAGRQGAFYPAYVVNLPSSRPQVFYNTAIKSTLMAGATITATYLGPDCEPTRPARELDFGLFVSVPGHDDEGFPQLPTGQPGISPSFFADPDTARTMIQSAADLVKVTRTSVFASPSSAVSIERLIGGSDSLREWLVATPPASGEDSADIRILTELVRVSDSAVVWSSDTISARWLAADSISETILVPTDTAATEGTQVFIRMRALVSQNVECFYNAGFAWVEDTTSDDAMQKPRRIRARTEARVSEASALAISVTPLPARGAAELKIASPIAGEIALNIFDAMGQLARAAWQTNLPQAGEYVLPIDLEGMTPGVYTVLAEIGGNRTSARIVVLR